MSGQPSDHGAPLEENHWPEYETDGVQDQSDQFSPDRFDDATRRSGVLLAELDPDTSADDP